MGGITQAEVDGLPWQEVESSNIERVAWVQVGSEDALGTLWVQFKGGRVYRYETVERERFEKLIAAESVGRFFASIIKSRPDQYPVERVEIADA